MKTLTVQQLALYLGCRVYVSIGRLAFLGFADLVGITSTDYVLVVDGDKANTYWSIRTSEVKPILRRLESMTEEEGWECWKLRIHNSRDSGVTNPKCAIIDHTFYAQLPLEGWAPMFVWLLSKHFDLFGWIDQGLAIDQETIKQEEK